MPEPRRYADYTRQDAHDVLAPGTAFTRSAGTWGLLGIVPLPNRLGDYAFFVTFGQRQGEHVFGEGITEDGVLSWQSQPSQSLADERIQEFIHHDAQRHAIYLFLRTRKGAKYTYLGRLKYLAHDPERERPVYFRWQILDWDVPPEVLKRMGLKLEPPAQKVPIDAKEGRLGEVSLPTGDASEGAGMDSLRDGQATAYARGEAQLTELAIAGAKLVVEHERSALLARGRADLAERVRCVEVMEGRETGYDIESYTAAGETKYIAVKTTRGPVETPFHVTCEEVEFSAQHEACYILYRVYAYDGSSAKFWVAKGALGRVFELTPSAYRVVPGGVLGA